MTPFFVLIKCQLGKAYDVANAIANAASHFRADAAFNNSCAKHQQIALRLFDFSSRNCVVSVVA